MADVKISALPSAEALAGGELVPVVQGGETRAFTLPSDPLAGQAGDDVAITGGAIDGVTLGATSMPVGGVFARQVAVGQAALATGGVVALVAAASGEQYRIRDIFAAGAFTNFSGGSGDRDISITDGTSTWSVLPAASLAALDNARWGETLIPWPAGKALGQSSAAGQNIRAVYSGGTTDYTAGAMTIVVLVERVA